ASAAIYSLIETAKANGLPPYEYLRYVFETLPTLNDDELTTLLPWHWKDTLPS
ncbi:transposase domain-containing protein, partial [Halomonas llamarensis]